MFDLSMFTLVHVVISVLGILSGLVAVGGLLAGVRLEGWTVLFLVTTILTSATGFLFPFTKILPSHIVGAISLVVLTVCLWARYRKQLVGRWRTVFVITAVAALYLNVFVLLVQLFVKTPPLAQFALTQQQAPFAATQALVFALFVWLGWTVLRSFRMEKAKG